MNTLQANDFTPENQRILLWDIDGTLLTSARNGAFREYTAPMLESVFGTAGKLAELQVSGMTDLQIVAEALRDENFTHEHIRTKLDAIRTRYMFEMNRAVAEGKQMFHALPGAREALEAVAAHPRYRSSLLTGNIEPAAYLKIKLVGLSDFFKLPGAFGDDNHDRRELPSIACARLSRHFNFNFQPAQFIVIGDTPNDIRCAKHFGARVVAVATGRSQTIELLRAHEPDALFDDLTDTSRFIQTIDKF
ncbi:MAG: HAD hydrolase-like protein [Pyrinomonadaceae bacterium]